MHYTYVLQNSTHTRMYTGATNNLRKRFKQHNEGSSNWTKRNMPWTLVCYEACGNDEEARSRELYLKSGMGKRYLKNRLKRFLSLTG